MSYLKWPDTRWTVTEVAAGLGVPVSAVWDWIAAGDLPTTKTGIADAALHTFLWRFPLVARSNTRNHAWVEGLLWDTDLRHREPPDVRAAREAAQAARRGQAASEARAA